MKRLTLFLCISFLILRFSVGEDTDGPLPPLEAAAQMKLPPGFKATLFAGEPDVKQPIGFCIDDRGRLWVAEAYNYPKHGPGTGDRIVILEDTDGDGAHDKRTVFYDQLNYVTGIEVGFGGAWVMSPPNMYFIPDADGDDKPDSEPRVLLDGFGNHANAHNLANGFAWGPDGWLYGTHGRTNWSMIGKPGVDDSQRERFDGGVYRYHPTRHVWEPYADGTTNPWGIDWNDYGHAFICNCVNPHLFQVIQGAHYEPWRGRKSSQFAYQRIDTIADHLHYVGISNVRNGIGSEEEDSAGGGHAHCGTMIYLGDALPAPYRNTLMTCNIHGRRINNDIPRRMGSGYVASHGPDVMRSADPWFMGVTLAYGPSGEIYVSDWSDTGECHSTRNTRRHTGRIFRIAFGQQDLERVDLGSKDFGELIELQMHDNDWMVRHARRRLQELAWAKKLDIQRASAKLNTLLANQVSVPKKLRAMWALHAIGASDEGAMIRWLDSDSDEIRGWAITLLCDQKTPSATALGKMVAMARSDPSALVRLSLASAMPRLPTTTRWLIGERLAMHAEDQHDQNLPLMVWYGIEPLVLDNPQRFAGLLASAAIPRVRINIARRLASLDQKAGLDKVFARVPSLSIAAFRDALTGVLEGIRGRRDLRPPEGWPHAFSAATSSGDSQLADLAAELAVLLRDPQATSQMMEVVQNRLAPLENRRRAIRALTSMRVARLDEVLLKLVLEPEVRADAIGALSSFNNSTTSTRLLEAYGHLNASEKQTALATLASRKNWTRELLAAIEEDRIPSEDITAFTARQIRALGDREISDRLASCWGLIRDTPSDRLKQIASIKKWMTPVSLSRGDKTRGAMIFKKQCATCHKFFGDGGSIGPDITGAQRTNIDYLLENIVDPSASVAQAYRMQVLQTEDGRVITGLVTDEDETTITIQTASEKMVLPADDVVARKESSSSIMPNGLLEPLSEQEILDLFVYLQRTE